MKLYIGIVFLFLLCSALVDYFIDNGKSEGRAMDSYRELTPEEERVIIHRGTELPGSDKYMIIKETRRGTYQPGKKVKISFFVIVPPFSVS